MTTGYLPIHPSTGGVQINSPDLDAAVQIDYGMMVIAL